MFFSIPSVVIATVFSAVTHWQTVYVAANTARCESGPNIKDGAVVLQTARNRARKWKQSLLKVLKTPNAFAFDCPASPRHFQPEHLILGLQAVRGKLDVPEWAKKSMFYCGPADKPDICHARRAGKLGEFAHTFYSRYVTRKGRLI
jgi:hypothetical protein